MYMNMERRVRVTKNNKSKSGQTMVEYIIIVVIIAICAIAIFGVFGDRIRNMLGGAVVELGGDKSAVSTAVDTKSQDFLKTIKKDGAGSGSSTTP
jgi:Flp pilus assembly pilin Flp